MLGLMVPVPTITGLGDKWPVGILFLLHIAVAEYSVGAVTLGAIMEVVALRNHDASAKRYARAVTRSYYLVFSFGATLAVFAVVLLTGLWGNLVGILFNRYLWILAAAFGLFLLITPLLVLHHATRDKMAPRAHATLGVILALLQTGFVVLIVTLDADLMTPVPAGDIFATSYTPLLVHRLIGNVSWTALLLAAYAAWKGKSTISLNEQAFQEWALNLNLRIGLWTALLMPLSGFFLVLLLHGSQPGYVANLTGATTGSLMVLQEALLGVVLVGGSLVLLRKPPRNQASTWGKFAPALVAAGMLGALLPSAVIPAQLIGIRYGALAIAVIATAAILLYSQRRSRAPSPLLDRRWLRATVSLVGAGAVCVSLLMGVIKESARGNYAIYGELRQSDAHAHFLPPEGTYP